MNSALSGAVSGGLLGIAGNFTVAGTAESYGAHAVAGCINASISGGKCGAGAAGGLTGKLFTNITDAWGPSPAQFAGVVIGGGIASKVGGGSFESGVFSAGLGYALNYCSAGKCDFDWEQKLYDWFPGYKAGTFISNKVLGGGGETTVWEVIDLGSAGFGLAAKGISAGLNGASNTVLFTSSVGNDASIIAAELGTTIAKTPVGWMLDKAGKLVPRLFWDEASRIFVMNARGTVNVIAGGPMNASSTFLRVELGAAFDNPNISRIVVMRLK